LKLGQKSQRNTVPTIEKRSLVRLAPAFLLVVAALM
jgi:hypothetical protein